MKFLERLTDPQTIRSLVVFIFGIGVIRGNLKLKIANLEKRIAKFESLELEGILAQIQTDLERIKKAMSRK